MRSGDSSPNPPAVTRYAVSTSIRLAVHACYIVAVSTQLRATCELHAGKTEHESRTGKAGVPHVERQAVSKVEQRAVDWFVRSFFQPPAWLR